MSDPAVERKHLADAERDIIDGEKRVTSQMLLIEQMRESGRDVFEAERLLRTLEETLTAWRAHREEILRELQRRNALPRHRGASCLPS